MGIGEDMPQKHSKEEGSVVEMGSNCPAVNCCYCFVSSCRICSYRPAAGWAAGRGESSRVRSKRISATVGDVRALDRWLRRKLAVCGGRFERS